ncbi:MAG TPA: YggS family pyridoxal phosphate-dependent enzyme [Candidatus Acidoferrales bacterium]|nr:YggS family pyridoxal phosphate-dependent enzyme [Candidatus Acidoferrales bacterium]
MRDPPRAADGSRGASGAQTIDVVSAKLQAIRQLVDDELRACGRAAGSVTIVGVSKKQPPEAVRAAIDAGLADIAENYLQEAKAKFAELAAVRKHFIGHLQTNKAKAVAELFDVVQSVDRIEAGAALSKAAQGLGKVLPVLLQINVSPTERFGCPPQQAERLAEALRGLPGLRPDGVMAIGPDTADSDEISKAFELAAKTFDRVGGSTLSIGMSGDWRQAVRAGSTMIRLGTALFGSRNAAP